MPSINNAYYGESRTPASSIVTPAGGGLGKPVAKGPKIFNPPLHKWSRFPYVPGHTATHPKNYNIGTISQVIGQPEAVMKDNWAFRFHYNPSAVNTNVQTNATVEQGPVSNLQNMFVGMQSLSFEIFLNRLPDVNTADPGEYPGGRGTVSSSRLRQLGTLVDIEWLYRTINGGPYDSTDTNAGIPGDYLGITADIGFLRFNIVDVKLGPSYKFRGMCTNLDISHQRFGTNMQPVYTTIGLTFNRVSNFAMPADQARSDRIQDYDNLKSDDSGGRGGI